MKCKFCGADISHEIKRCRDCGSWLSYWSYLFHAETIPKVIGLVVAVLVALFTLQQASNAHKERAAAEEAKKDVADLAENMTKLAYVIIDGSGRWGGVPKQHINKINEYKNALKKYLPPTIDDEIKKTLKDLNVKDKE